MDFFQSALVHLFPVFRRVAILRGATVSFVMSVRVEHLGSQWADFHEIWYFSIFRKTVDKTRILLKSSENSGCFALSTVDIFVHISLSSYWNEKCLDKVIEEIRTHLIFSNFFSKIVPFVK